MLKHSVNRGDDDPDHKEWAKLVKERDGFRCDICNISGVALESHHLNSYYHYPDQRYNIDNGVCLCAGSEKFPGCHKKFHNIYGSDCHKWQYLQFKKTCEILQKIAKKK